MIPANAVAAQIQAYLQSQDVQQLVQAVDAIQDIEPLFTVGERVHAEVTSQLPSGRFAVLIKDQLLDLNLPRNTQPGEQLDLEVIAQDPKLTLLLLGRTPPSADKLAAASLPAATQTPPRSEAERVDLSKTGQFIESLLSESPATDNQTRTRLASLQSAAPLVGTARPDPAKLAGALKDAIAQSGMFYESHQADWIEGKRDLASLFKEPQAAFSRLPLPAANLAAAAALASNRGAAGAAALAANTAASTAASAAGSVGNVATAEPPPEEAAAPGTPVAPTTQLLAETEAGLPTGPASLARPAPTGDLAAPTTPKPQPGGDDSPQEVGARQQGLIPVAERRADAAPPGVGNPAESATATPLGKSGVEDMPGAIRQLVQQQLESLDRRQVSWVGQVWPGQTMQWDIEEDGGGRGGNSGDPDKPATVWRSRLQLDLPSLGPVTALVTLTGKQQVDVRFSVVLPDTAQRIRDHQQKLDHAMEAAGLQLASNLVAVDALEPGHGE